MTTELSFTTLVGLNYEGWSCYIEGSSGALHWYHPDTHWYVIATPNWDTMGVTPWWVSNALDERDDFHGAIHYADLRHSSLEGYLQTLKKITSNFI